MEETLQKYSADGTNKPEEYFKLKKQASTLRADLKDWMAQQEKYEELQALKKKVKKINDEIKDQERYKEIKEKLDQIKERQDLLKEMIRIELIENSEEQIKNGDRVLKLVYVVKEARD